MLCLGTDVKGREPRLLLSCELPPVSLRRVKRELDLWLVGASAVPFTTSATVGVESRAAVFSILVALRSMCAPERPLVGPCAAVGAYGGAFQGTAVTDFCDLRVEAH